MNLSENIKKIRKENNLSQEALADKLNVSRQSVSKWESGSAYPEMDKVLQICKMFNLNIDELMNQDINQVNNSKQEKKTFNKYFDDFTSFIGKSIDMFSSMSFKTKFVCFFEHLGIVGIMTLILYIIGAIGSSIFSNLFGFASYKVYNILHGIVSSLYLICSVILVFIIVVTSFKRRYLNYYVIVHSEKDNAEEEVKEEKASSEEVKENKKVYLEKKQEKIVIRDPEGSGYNFMHVIFNIFLVGVKICAGFILMFVLLAILMFSIFIVLSFMISKTGTLFVGSLLGCIFIIVALFVIAALTYDFIINKKPNKILFGYLFLVSIIGIGISGGLFINGITKLNYVKGYESDGAVTNVYEYSVVRDIYFSCCSHIEYSVEDIDGVKVEVISSKYSNIYVARNDDELYFHYRGTINMFDNIKGILSDINSKNIIDYSEYKVIVHANSDTINYLKKNYYN